MNEETDKRNVLATDKEYKKAQPYCCNYIYIIMFENRLKKCKEIEKS